MKERFWRRDAEFIVEDGEESESDPPSDAESEALEEGQREKQKPHRLEVGKLDSQQMFEMLHSESQREPPPPSHACIHAVACMHATPCSRCSTPSPSVSRP